MKLNDHRTTVYIPRDLWKWVRSHCLDRGITAAELIRRCLQRYKDSFKDRT